MSTKRKSISRNGVRGKASGINGAILSITTDLESVVGCSVHQCVVRLVQSTIGGEIVDEPAREGEGVGGTASGSGLAGELCQCTRGRGNEERYRLPHGCGGVLSMVGRAY